MKLNPLRRIKERWSRRREEKSRRSERAPNFSRRAFLAGTGAFVAANIIGCRTIPLTEEQIQDLKKFNELQAQPPYITENRLGKSVKHVLETLAKADPDEVSMAKERGGQIRNVTIRSTNRDAYSIYNRKTTRSYVHTHPQAQYQTDIQWKLSSMPSIQDMMSLIQDSHHREGDFKTKFMHVAVMNWKNEVIGYHSIGIGKRLQKLLNPSFFTQFSDEYRALKRTIRSMKDVESRFKKLNTPEDAEKYYQEYTRCLETLKELGLLQRKTPMPGYVFKGGYFQSKT